MFAILTLATKVKQLWVEMHAEKIQTKADIKIIGNKVYKKSYEYFDTGRELFTYNKLMEHKIPNISVLLSVTIEMKYAGPIILNVPNGYKLLKPIYETLQSLIKKQIIYIDIKPENICVLDGEVTLIDFELCNCLRFKYDFDQIYAYWPPEFVQHSSDANTYNKCIDTINEVLFTYYKITIPFHKITDEECQTIRNSNIKTNIWSIGVLLYLLKAEGKYLEMAQKCIHWNPELRPSYDDLINM